MTHEEMTSAIKSAIAYLHRYQDRRQDDAQMAHAARNTKSEEKALNDVKEITFIVDELHKML